MNARALDDRRRVRVGLDVGQRAVDVVGRQVAVPELLEQHLHGCVGQLLLEDVPGLLFGIRPRVPQHEAGPRDDLEVVGVSAVGAGARLDVDVELLRFGAAARTGEKIRSEFAAAKSRPCGEMPACTMTGRPCGLRGTVKRPSMSNCAPVCANAPGGVIRQELPARLVGEDGILRPRVPQLPHGVRRTPRRACTALRA